jgi:putative endonuclease
LSTRGERAEATALRYLESKGLSLIAQNYRCRFGEIDLIMRDGKTTVFTEVRLRKSNAFGGALASIDSNKQRRILSAARHYLSEQRGSPICRCDVVLLSGISEQGIEWIQNAFSE